jgi:hypothetical protein
MGDVKNGYQATPNDEIERLQSEVYRLRAAIRVRGPGVSDAMRGEIAYQLTKRLVIDMPTARAGVTAAGPASAGEFAQRTGPARLQARRATAPCDYHNVKMWAA